MKVVVRGGFAVFLLAMGLVGCGESPPVEPAASGSDGLINGFELDPFAENSGVVFIKPNLGTGILLTNEWVLTVAHNLGSAGYIDPSSISLVLGGLVPGTETADGNGQPVGSGQVKNASQVIVHPFVGVGTLNSTATSPADLALIRVESPFEINGSTTDHRFQTYKGTAASLVNQHCLVYGAGPNAPGGGVGAVRYGLMEVTSVPAPEASNVRTGMEFIADAGDNGAGQPIHTAQGDSGAPCFIDGEVAGIFHAAVPSTQQSAFMRPELFQHWVDRVLFEKGASDLSNDDAPDLVFRNRDASSSSAGSNVFWRFDRTISDNPDVPDRLTQVEQTSLIAFPDVNWNILGSGDFDADGKMDFVLQYESGPTVQDWTIGFWMNGTSDFKTPGAVNRSWRVKAVADINQDGVSDLIWQFENTPNYAIWHMNKLELGTPASGIVRGSALLAAEPASGFELIGAIDLDHFQLLSNNSVRVNERPLAPDLVFRNTTTGEIRLRRMVFADGGYVRHPNPDPVTLLDLVTGVPAPAVRGSEWTLVSTADFNQDGFSDWIWQCTNATQCGTRFRELEGWFRRRFSFMDDPTASTPKDTFQFVRGPIECGGGTCSGPSGSGWLATGPR